jgi:hypothetical protein
MTSPPIRIQRRRTKGFNLHQFSLEANGRICICVSRPSKYSNPFDWRQYRSEGDNAKGVAVDMFREWLEYPARFPNKPPPPASYQIRELRGRNLACWCSLADPFCHADVLLEIANK